MKQWLHESRLLLIFFSFFSFFISIACAVFLSNQTRQLPTYPFLSRQGLSFSIPESEENRLTYQDLYLFLLENREPLTVTKTDSFTHTVEVYATSPVEAGGSWAVGEPRAEAVLSAEEKPRCVERDGAFYYYYNNYAFRVVRFFEPEAEPLPFNYGINLLSSLQNNPSIPLAGDFALDAGAGSAGVFEKLNRFFQQKSPGLALEAAEIGGETRRAFSADDKMVAAGVCVLACLLLLNIVSLNRNWLSQKKKELFVRRMAGGGKGRILFEFLREYSAAAATGFLFGGGAAFLFSRLSPFRFIAFHMSFSALLLALLAVFFFTCLSALAVAAEMQREPAGQQRG